MVSIEESSSGNHFEDVDLCNLCINSRRYFNVLRFAHASALDDSCDTQESLPEDSSVHERNEHDDLPEDADAFAINDDDEEYIQCLETSNDEKNNDASVSIHII